MTHDLLREDFADLPVAVIGGDYSPSGEYHVVPELADTGRWREVMIHHSYRRVSTSRGNWQVVVENDGTRALEQTITHDRLPPLIATGDESWTVDHVSVRIRPLTRAGRRGLVFCYRHASDHFAVVLDGSELTVVRRHYDTIEMLGSAQVVVDPDTFTEIVVDRTGADLRIGYAGHTVLSLDGALQGSGVGGVALLADRPCRFADLVVTGDASPASSGATSEISPILWRTFRTGDWGSDRNLRVGDLDGDGRPELVFARRTDRLGSDNFSTISSLAAFTLDGERIWTYGEPSVNEYATTSDLCFQLHDLDNDGRCEVILCRDSELMILDGATGEVRQRRLLPEHPTGTDDDLFRALGDSIYFADLNGTGHRDCLLVKDRYRNLWAFDANLEELWSFTGNLGHFPYTADIDGDGREEVMIGHTLLDHDGSVIWQVQYPDHSDNVALLELQRTPGEPAELVSVIAGSDAGLIMIDRQGSEVARFPIGHAQSMCFGNLVPDRPGRELMVNTFWGPVGIHAVFDEAGALLHDFEPMPYASLLQLVNWTATTVGEDPTDLVLLSTHPVQGGLIDGYGRRQVMFPDDGHPVLCSAVYDLDGDGVDEILTWDEDEVWIYKAEVPGRGPHNYPDRNPWCNESNYRIQVSLPRNPATD